MDVFPPPHETGADNGWRNLGTRPWDVCHWGHWSNQKQGCLGRGWYPTQLCWGYNTPSRCFNQQQQYTIIHISYHIHLDPRTHGKMKVFFRSPKYGCFFSPQKMRFVGGIRGYTYRSGDLCHKPVRESLNNQPTFFMESKAVAFVTKAVLEIRKDPLEWHIYLSMNGWFDGSKV